MQWKTGLVWFFSVSVRWSFFVWTRKRVSTAHHIERPSLQYANHKISIDSFDLKMLNCSALVWNQSGKRIQSSLSREPPQDPHVVPVHHSWHLCIVAFRPWIFHINRLTTDCISTGLVTRLWPETLDGLFPMECQNGPIRDLFTIQVSPENTSGLKLERANGLARWTDQHKGEESGGVACRCWMTSFRRGAGGGQGQTAWQGSPTQLSQQQSSAKCTSTRSQAQDDGFLHASLSAHASLKTAKRKTLTCFHWREGKLSSFLLNTKQRLSEGFKIWVWKVLWLDF